MPPFLASAAVQSCLEPHVPAAAGWSCLYEAAKPRHAVAAPAPCKRRAYGGMRSLELCTEALGCETGAVDVAWADEAVTDAEGVERKRQEREETAEGRAGLDGRGGGFPPPLTTLARGASRMRLVHERRDGRLAVYAVRLPRVEAERGGGRLRLRLLPFSHGNSGADEEAQEAEEEEEERMEEETEAEYGMAKYTRSGRCMEEEGAATGTTDKKWEAAGRAAAFWVATS